MKHVYVDIPYMEPLEKVPGLKDYFFEKKTATLDVHVASTFCQGLTTLRIHTPPRKIVGLMVPIPSPQ